MPGQPLRNPIGSCGGYKLTKVSQAPYRTLSHCVMSINYLGLAASVAATLGVYALCLLLRVIHKEFTSPLRNVPGPKSAHWFLGDHLQLFKIVRHIPSSMLFLLNVSF
jgi:hypothetical protein